jgi:thiamine biosynthesis lipoprotein
VVEPAPDVREVREMMGTRVTVAIVGVPPEEARRGMEAAFQVFERVDEVMNEWRPQSPLSAINKGAGGAAVAAPEDLCQVIRMGLDGAARTNDLFDPTWAALRDLWRFKEGATVPDAAALKARCPLVAWREVEVAPALTGDTGGLKRGDVFPGCTVRLKKAGMQLGLGGIAKGWGVDKAVEKLRAMGFKDFFVQAGGDLYAAGKRGDRPWRVGIRDPRGPEEKTFATLEVTDAAFSTSGDYERFFLVGDKRYHHLIDPRNCQPAGASRSSTVLARSAIDAEILTKATFILGGKKALELAEKQGAGVVLVTHDNQVLVSRSLKGRLRWHPPTP